MYLQLNEKKENYPYEEKKNKYKQLLFQPFSDIIRSDTYFIYMYIQLL